jgi:exoribonuclease-2
MSRTSKDDRSNLSTIARRAMIERGMEPDFSPAVQREVASLRGPAAAGAGVRDLRELLWASIDNDDSRDLDQLTVAESLDAGQVRVLVAIADVDALVPQDDAIDDHARQNTTSVYTTAAIFPMLPEVLSTGLTSLNQDEDRVAVVVDMRFDADGALAASEIYRAQVRNRAKLAYRSVAAWLEGESPAPQRLAEVPGLEANLRVQDGLAQKLAALRHRRGALSLESVEAKPVFDGEALADLVRDPKNRAKQIIEDFMIAANGASAAYLEAKGFPSLRRVLRSPDRWDRLIELALRYGEQLPTQPDPVALEAFLTKRREAKPEAFVDLSLAVVKLIGRGEYAVDLPGGDPPGHFGLAVRDYAHSTAPNRRFPDLITQRLIKVALSGGPAPYSVPRLMELADHCTSKEDDATKVERRVAKSAAALLLSGRIGESFDAVVTGASFKGTWVRIANPPVEGRLERGTAGLDVGDPVRVKLIDTDVERGFIDFARD